jgi:N6-L-threonylcarbamoyladenine synthase
MSNFLEKPAPAPPAVCLLVSGGHTDLILIHEIGKYEILGRTRDDAAGEAFDKAARLLGLGYPGGPEIQKAAESATGKAIDLPRPMMHSDSLEFSFSGLKTALLTHKKRVEAQNEVLHVQELAAGFQEAVVDVLVSKTLRAAEMCGVKTVLLCGGVAANRLLRERLKEQCERHGLTFFSPPFILCTDNAAMVAKTGYENFSRGKNLLALSPQPNLSI